MAAWPLVKDIFQAICAKTPEGEACCEWVGRDGAGLAHAGRDRARDKQHAYLRVQDILNGIPESPERHDAWRLANDRLGLTVQLRAAAREPRLAVFLRR